MLITMTSRPSTTLIRCRGAEKTLLSQRTFGRSANWTHVFLEMKLAKVPGVETNLYLVPVLYHPLNQHLKIIKCGCRFPWDLRIGQTKTFIDCKINNIIRLIFQSKKKVPVVSTFRFHAISVWAPTDDRPGIIGHDLYSPGMT